MPELAHYTTLENLYSILKSQELWASSIRYLNDEREIDDALDYITRVAQKPTNQKDGLEHFVEAMREVQDSVSSSAGDSVFVVSFSVVDLLSQWRAYSPNNDGCAITFDFEKMDRDLVECVYHDSEKERIVRKLLNEGWRNLDEGSYWKERTEYLSFLEDKVTPIAATFKDKNFAEEQERRIIVRNGKVQCRPGRGYLVPYVAVPFDLSAVKSIMIGPTRHPDLAKQSMRRFLGCLFEEYYGDFFSHALPNVEVSAIPYRVG